MPALWKKLPLQSWQRLSCTYRALPNYDHHHYSHQQQGQYHRYQQQHGEREGKTAVIKPNRTGFFCCLSSSTQRSVILLFQVVSEEPPTIGKKEQSLPERKDWQEKAPSIQPKEREREARDLNREKEKERDKEKATQKVSQGDDFERTPSGRVRRRSAQVAVFHLQEIAEDELAKDWGTKRRIKDDLVPDSKRVRGKHTPLSHRHFSPKQSVTLVSIKASISIKLPLKHILDCIFKAHTCKFFCYLDYSIQ